MTASLLETRLLATDRQRAKIAQLCMALRIQERLEEDVTTSEEASRLITQMCDWLKVRRASSRRSVNGGAARYS